MDLEKRFGTDKNLEENGVWIESDGAKFLIARLGNSKSKELLASVQRNAKLNAKFGSSDDSLEDLVDMIAKSVLLNWENVKVAGKDLPYSVANAKKMLIEYRDFRELIVEISSDMESFRKEQIEEGKENLKKS